jgi:hypothetical protein
MSKCPDLDDVAETSPLAKSELVALRTGYDSLRHALQEACIMRAALCRNGGDDEPPKDPATWDRPLQRWLKALKGEA